MEAEHEVGAGAGDGDFNGVNDLQSKRGREEEEGDDVVAKRTKTVESAEEKTDVPVKIGPKSFGSSVEMYDYFFKLLHSWSPNLGVNKYEELALAELLRQGHAEPETKIGAGIRSFEHRQTAGQGGAGEDGARKGGERGGGRRGTTDRRRGGEKAAVGGDGQRGCGLEGEAGGGDSRRGRGLEGERAAGTAGGGAG
ncbi:DCL-like protein [Wolffia australiana]